MNTDRLLHWTPELAEKYWNVVYRLDLFPAQEERRSAPFLAAIIRQEIGAGGRVVEIGSRSAALPARLVRTGLWCGRLATGALAPTTDAGVASSPLWLGDIGLDEARTADCVVGADVLARLCDDELEGWFAAARVMVRWTGVLCVSTKNAEAVSDRYAACPACGKMFSGEQRLRTFDVAALRTLLEREGFRVERILEAELRTEALNRHPEAPLSALAREAAYIGNGETLVMIARPSRPPSSADYAAASGWLKRRQAVAPQSPPAAVPFEWTAKSVEKFWTSLQDTPLEDLGFGLQVGGALVGVIEPWLTPGGRHLDVGAGGGDVARLLAEAGYPVATLELSDGRRRKITETLAGVKNFLGVVKDASRAEPFDAILLAEVIEHINQSDDDSFFAMLRKALKPGGRLIVTTPSNERLHESLQYCPQSDRVFHRWQHVRSFSPQSLADRLGAHGFHCRAVHDVDFAAIARGAAPFFEMRFNGTGDQKVGQGGTLVAIADFVGVNSVRTGKKVTRIVERKVKVPAYAGLSDPMTNLCPFRDEVESLEPIPDGPVEGRSRGSNRSESPMALHSKVLHAMSSLKGLFSQAKSTVSSQLAASASRLEAAAAPAAQIRRIAAPRLAQTAPLIRYQPNDSAPILLINNALAWGGVERQVVNTLLGLERRTKRDLGLICLKLGEGGDYAFYKPALAAFRGVVRDMTPIAEARAILAAETPAGALEEAKKVIAWLPQDVQENIERLMADFVALKPAVVHAWQDNLSIEAAFAAKLVGAPKIIVSSRNMAPPNFAYFRPHQRDAYREIAACDDIFMVANSDAGAMDYARWIGVTKSRFGVVRNGLDLASLQRAPDAEVAALRASLGIPEHAQVVGSIFRFYDEKQPLLWMDVAREVAGRASNVHFAVFGVGPRAEEAKAFAAAHGFGDRFHNPGTIENAALALSMFDCFVLTSKFEGTPNVVLEASALGVPVVATPAGGTAEAVEEGVTGWIVADSDPNVMANRACQALGDADFRRACLEAGPAFVQRRYGLERMLDETLALYGVHG